VELVLASRNAHKLRELGMLLAPFELVRLPDGVELPPEGGATYAENALAKARAGARATGKLSLGEDSGIEASALGGAPGVRSARYAGEEATDEDNLAKLLRETEGRGDRAAAYVCALALVAPDGEERLFEARCEGVLARGPRGNGGFGYDPIFEPTEGTPGLTMAELTPDRKNAISHRGQAAALLLHWLGQAGAGAGERQMSLAGEEPSGSRRPPGPELVAPAALAPPGASKSGAARLSVISNSALIALKLVAGAVTGSIAIITEAIHSSIDLLASIVAYLSVRKADEPADADHMYGHAKVENLAAAIEGMLILVGAAVIVYEAVRRLATGAAGLSSLGFGITAIAISAAVNLGVSTYLYRRARLHDSPALEGDAAHLRADALTSFGVLIGLVLIEVTGVEELDAVVALMVAAAIVWAGVRILTRSSRVLVDEALPAAELDAVKDAIASYPGSEVVSFHKLRSRRAGSARYIDLHVQFAPGTTLERAHAIAHQLQDAIRARIRGADVLVHLEPERPDRGVPKSPPAGS
jgi:non-canonical purine NTP pyrophosphatase (RdgB/HAM1 family)